jgi:serine protease
MRKPLLTLGLVGAALLAPWSLDAPLAQTVAAASVAGPSSGAATARVIVKYKADAASLRKTIQAASATPTATVLGNRAQSLGTRLGMALGAGHSIGARSHVVSATGLTSDELAQRIARDADVEYAAPDRIRRRFAVPADLFYASRPYNNPTTPTSGGPLVGQWYLKPPGAAGTLVSPSGTAPASINAEGAWDITTGSASIVVAVLDTGIRFDHEDFKTVAAGGNLLPGYDFLSDDRNSADGQPGRDTDASDPGDAVTQADVDNGVPGCTPGQIDPSSWHGTETAGLIGAITDNGVGIASVGRAVRILPVRVLGKCGGYDSDIVAGMLWAAGIHVDGVPDNTNAARVINMSLGGAGACDSSNSSARVYLDAVAQINAVGGVVVASAGNSAGHSVSIPADCAGVIGVAGLRHIGTKVGFSDIGPEITISAPGGNCINTAQNTACLYSILTTTNTGTGAPVPNASGGSTYSDSFDKAAVGTSFSAPLVAGTVALMLSVQPQLSPDEVRFKLQSTARPFPQPTVDESGGALQACTTPTTTSPDQLQCVCQVGVCGAGMLDARAAVLAAAGVQARITVDPAAPTAGQTVTFGSASSILPAGRTIASYQWAVTSGGSIVPSLTGATSPSATAVPTGAGTFTVSLTVTDSSGVVSSEAVSVDVADAPNNGEGGGGGGGALGAGWLALLAAAVVALRIVPGKRSRP